MGDGRNSRPKAKSGVWFLGRGIKPHELGGLGERCELPTMVRSGTLTSDHPKIFRLDALAKALSVIATATWLGGWLGVCHTPVLYQNG